MAPAAPCDMDGNGQLAGGYGQQREEGGHMGGPSRRRLQLDVCYGSHPVIHHSYQ